MMASNKLEVVKEWLFNTTLASLRKQLPFYDMMPLVSRQHLRIEHRNSMY